jgi:ParB-like chromosome segregation protein Spo0J
VRYLEAGSPQSACIGAVAGPAGVPVHAEVSAREVVAVPVASLLPGESPRLEGEDKAHIARLMETEAPLPPILVDRRSMRVIDGMHRLMAASLNGRERIDVEFFDGTAADAFLRAVETNMTHGLPLSQADRRVAAARIIASHPHMSDRAIAQSAGLGAKRVAGIRRRSAGVVPQLSARVGRDGRVRPLDGVQGRRRAAELMAEHPDASLREVAQGAGVSPATARDVRRRLERGDEPAAAGRGAGGSCDSAEPARAGRSRARRATRAVQPATPAFVLEKLLRDPSLRHNERGRWLLRWLQHNAVGAEEWSGVIAAVPPHCAALVVQLARQYSQMWLDFAQKLDERAQVTDP